MPNSQQNLKKPYADIPLTFHRNGQWCKKTRGSIHYFDTSADAALQKYVSQRDDLQAGAKERGRT